MTAPNTGAGGWRQMPGGYPGGQPSQQPVPGVLPQPAQQPTFQSTAPLPPGMQQPNFDGGWPAQQAHQMAQPPAPAPAQQPPASQQQPPAAPAQPQFGQPQQPQFQPPAASAAPAGMDLNTRLYGPQFPAEMQGRTMGELLATYNGMRNLTLQMIPTEARPNGTQLQVPQPSQAQQPQQPSQPAPAYDWRNPMPQIEAAVGRIIDQRLAPVVESAQQQRIAQAANVLNIELGPQVVGSIQQELIQNLQGATPEALANPNTWRVAARAIIGDRAIRQAQQMPQQGGPQQPQLPGAFQPQQVPPGAQPIPNIGTFFTERPGQGGTGVQPQTQLTDMQRYFARQMNMSDEMYLAWSGGNVPQQTQQQPAWGGR